VSLEIGREAFAYIIMAVVAAIAIPVLLIQARRRRLVKLRRRGIKRYDR